MTSLEIAQLTGKYHASLLKSIRKMEKSWLQVAEDKFDLGYYLDKNNQERPLYKLNKSQCLFIATKFNDIARAKVSKRWKGYS